MDKNCGIYAIINQVNGKLYIGSAKDFNKRKQSHIYELKNNTHGLTYKNGELIGKTDHLQHAWNEYSEESFKWEILEYCKEDKLREREQYYIDKYNVCNPHCGYNLSTRADRSIMSPDGKERVRQSNSKRGCPEATRKRISESNKGKASWNKGIPMGEKQRKHLSEARTGTKRTPESIEKTRQGNIGKKQPAEAIEKTRQAHIGRKRSEETRKNLSKSLLGVNKGKKFSKEHKEKMILNNPKMQKQYNHLVVEWRKLKQEGISYAEIGRRYNTTHSTVSKYINKYYPE